jgi:hypothetical protein
MAVVLVPYLATPQQTYAELGAVIHHEHWESDHRAKHYEWSGDLAVCGAPHEPGLRWEVIDMDGGPRCAHTLFGGELVSDRSPLLSAEFLPHAGVLAEIAHSPYWARSLGGAVPAIWIPGYVSLAKHMGIDPVVGNGEHVMVTGYSNSDTYAKHRRGVRLEHFRPHAWSADRELSTPVLM